MPIYPQNKTFRGGFYNNKVIEGVNDRVYSAKDIRKPYDVIFSDGIKPEPDGEAGNGLKVTADSNFKINIASGYAKLGGAWFENTATYTITLDNPISTTRYDCVIIRNDDTEAVREPSIYIKSLSQIPTVNDLIRNDEVYEICIAYVRVTAETTEIKNSDIIDTRTDGSLCNVMSGVGATVIRTYRNTYFSEAINQTSIPIGIPQYNKSRDTLTVTVEGRVFSEGTNYTITSNTHITLNMGLPVINTKIDFEVLKNVNAAGNETVVAEVADLQNWRNNVVDKALEYHYCCNGLNDNVSLSTLTQSLIVEGTDISSVKVYVHGYCGVTNPYLGSGTASDPYRWFSLGSDSTQTRKVIFDFTNCREITIPVISGATNVVFYGQNVSIVGVSVTAENAENGTVVNCFNAVTGAINASNCRFTIAGYSDSFISKVGLFTNCYGKVINATGHSWCFPVTKYLRLISGEYYAYHDGSSTSAIAFIDTPYQSAAVVALGVSCPNVSLSGYDQTWAWYSKYANKLTAIGTITQNPSYIENTTINEDGDNTRNILGTIPLNISNTI